MINILEFVNFLKVRIEKSKLYFDNFKPNLIFVDWNFDASKDYKITIEISDKHIAFSTISKTPSVDFSLHDYYLDSNQKAEEFVNSIIQKGNYPFRR